MIFGINQHSKGAGAEYGMNRSPTPSILYYFKDRSHECNAEMVGAGGRGQDKRERQRERKAVNSWEER